MPLLADRVRETTTTVGTGAVSLGGAVVGFQSFNAAFVNGSTVYYVIQYNTEWEIGIGTVGTGTLSRDTVLQSSNADALVPFSAGVKDVFCSYVADRAVTTSDAATLTNKTIEDYTNNVAANSTHFRIKATGTIAKGAVVKATGFNPGEQAIQVAVVTSATDLALGIAEAALTTGQFGLAVVIGELFDINTNGFTVGAVIYSNGSGGYTETKPSSGTYQPLGWVVRSNSSNGVIAVNIVAPLYVETSTATANTVVLRDGSGNFSAGTITASFTGSVSGNASTATALQTSRNINGVAFNGTADITVTAAAGTLTGTSLASNVVSSSLTSVGTIGTGVWQGTAIADTYLATISTAGKVANSATTATALNTANAIVARDASGDFSAGTITATAVNATTLDLTNLEVTNIKAKDGTQAIAIADSTGKLTISDGVLLSGLTASQAVFTDSSKNLVSNAITGTGNVVMSASPTLTGTVTAATLNATTLGGTLSTAAQTNVTSVGTLSSLTVSGNLTVDTDTLFVDATNNRVGIGTTTPAYPLQVRRAGGAGSLGIGIDSVGSTERVVQYFSVQDSAAGAGAGHAFYYRPQGSTTDTLGVLLDELGNVGVGTSSPDVKLDVEGTVGTSTALMMLKNTSAANASNIAQMQFWSGNSFGGMEQIASIHGINPNAGANNGGSLVLSTSANGTATTPTERARIDASGNLGLGVTPSANDQGNALFLASGREIIYSGPSGYLSANATYSAAADRYIINGFASSYVQSNGTHVWRTAPSGTAGNAITFTQAMTLDASGNLGIGTTPSYKLDVAGSIRINDRGTSFALRYPDWSVYNTTSGNALAFDNGSERARIDASGNLGLGVTPSADWGSSAYKAFVVQAAYLAGSAAPGALALGNNNYNDGAGFKYVATGVASLYLQNAAQHSWHTAPSGTAGNAITFTQAMTLDASGNLLVGTTSANYNSSGRGLIELNGSSQSLAAWKVGDSPKMYAQATSTNAYLVGVATPLQIETTGSNVLTFATNSTERARISSSGDFVVGATSTTFRIAALVAGGADREILQAGISGVSNGFTVRWNHSTTKTHVQIIDIPTSSAGLPAGTLWSDAGTIKIA